MANMKEVNRFMGVTIDMLMWQCEGVDLKERYAFESRCNRIRKDNGIDCPIRVLFLAFKEMLDEEGE